ncbi:MAG: response regulator transcription factor [Firmicutes bacterium]|nr:response regulator transcription factor [Bacillota bacterium]NBI63280.1 DNA-binding response regulator [Clostridiales bacterium]
MILKTILIIDDDPHIGNMLEETLIKEGYSILRAYSGTEAVLLLSQSKPDLVLLDLMLPGLCGEEVLPHIKDIPVIVVSAKLDMDNKIALLLNGAVDYVTKPFHTKELLARIAAHLRTFDCLESQERDTVLSFDDLRMDTDSREARIQDKTVKLTRTEYAILKLLMENPKQVITKSLLLDRISEDTPDCTETSLKTHVSNLRKKLRSIGEKDYIEAVWGIGFKMKSQ